MIKNTILFSLISFNFVLANPLYDVAGFCWKRVSNTKELLWDTAIEAPVDLVLGDYSKKLGHNPTAKCVLRDGIKAVSAVGKAKTNTTVGGTKYVYDNSQLYSQISKVTLKLGGIYALSNMMGLDAERAATIANVPGDIVARYIVKMGQARQDDNSTLSVEEYALTHFEPMWIVETVAEVGPKTAVATAVGALVKKSNIGMEVRKAIMHTGNHLLGLKMHAGETVYKNIGHLANKHRNAPIVFGIMTVAYVAQKIVETWIMAPICRITMDGVTVIVDLASGLAKDLYCLECSHDEF